MRVITWALVLGCVVGCPARDGGGDDDDAGFADAGFADAGVVDVDDLAVLDDEDDIAALAGEGGAIKYLAPVAGAPATPPIDGCRFQNTTLFPFHIPYLNHLLEESGGSVSFDDYIARVLRRDTRRWWGGEVLWRESAPHPITGDPGTMVFALYTEDTPGNRLVADDVRAVYALLRVCAPAFAEDLAFGPSSPEQRTTAGAIRAELAAEGIAVLTN